MFIAKNVAHRPMDIPKAINLNLMEQHTLKVVLLNLDRQGLSSCVGSFVWFL